VIVLFIRPSRRVAFLVQALDCQLSVTAPGWAIGGMVTDQTLGQAVQERLVQAAQLFQFRHAGFGMNVHSGFGERLHQAGAGAVAEAVLSDGGGGAFKMRQMSTMACRQRRK